MAKDDFLGDKRTQQAVIMSLIVVGEAATNGRLRRLYPGLERVPDEEALEGAAGIDGGDVGAALGTMRTTPSSARRMNASRTGIAADAEGVGDVVFGEKLVWEEHEFDGETAERATDLSAESAVVVELGHGEPGALRGRRCRRRCREP